MNNDLSDLTHSLFCLVEAKTEQRVNKILQESHEAGPVFFDRMGNLREAFNAERRSFMRIQRLRDALARDLKE